MKRSVLLALTLFLVPTAGFGEVPPWLRQLASAPPPTFPKDVPAVVLLNQRVDRVESNGKLTTVIQYAVRILDASGKGRAVARAIYASDTAEVRQLHAWMIRPSGAPKEYDKKETVDVALMDNDVYNEVHVKVIFGADDAEVGAVFGYEAEVEDRSVFTQTDWAFQDRLPAALSRYSLYLPQGWRAESMTFNRAEVTPVVGGTTYSWELKNLPYVRDEEAQPGLSQLVPRLAVSYYPPSGASIGIRRTFASWADVSQWLTELSEPSAIANQAVTQKAQELTAGINDPMARVAAIGKFVQAIQYISIQTGLGRGGGYRPHSAPDVLAKSYGDCKDKANLMRTMLRAIGITAYPVSIYLGDPLFVRKEWPSPHQFNHAIIAIKLADDADVRNTVIHPKFGKLLLFDPTDSETPVGELSEDLQGSNALLNAGRDGDLFLMPKTDSHLNHVSRQIDASLGDDGSMLAKIVETSTGQRAVDERRSYSGQNRAQWTRMIESWIARGAPGASVRTMEATGEKGGEFKITVEFVSPRYGQLVSSRLLTFVPAVVSRSQLAFSDEKRESPLWFDGRGIDEVATFKFPAAFKVDELPENVRIEKAFGSYEITYQASGQQVTVTRKTNLRAGLIPVSDYAAVREFFRAISSADHAPVVLIRQR